VQVGQQALGHLVHTGGAARAGRVPVRAEHHVLDDQLAAAAEQIGQPGRAVRPLEHVVLFDQDHRQPPPFRVERVALAGQRLFLVEQLAPGFDPLGARHDLGQTHG
jgi:hypothetical protein